MYADNSVLKHKENLDTYYTSCYRHWIDAFSEAYGKLSAIYEEVGGRVITGHCRLADKVYSTTYESGKRILVGARPWIRDCLNGMAAAEQGRG